METTGGFGVGGEFLAALAGLAEVAIPLSVDAAAVTSIAPSYPGASEFVRNVTVRLLADEGDRLPVSAFPPDGTWPSGTTRWEKRNRALEIPAWDEAICIQCNKCALVCPHAAIRVKAYPQQETVDGMKSMAWKGREFPEGSRFTVQLSPEDCTGCTLCVDICPAKSKENENHNTILPALGREYQERDHACNPLQAGVFQGLRYQGPRARRARRGPGLPHRPGQQGAAGRRATTGGARHGDQMQRQIGGAAERRVSDKGVVN